MMRNIRILVILLLLPSIANALNVETHKTINEMVGKVQTPNGFSLNQYLIDNLGFSGGVEEPILNSSTNVNQKISFWLRDGGEYEDIPAWYLPYFRSVNHFHNPITDQGFSGVWGTGFASGESAILWSQRAIGAQSPGGYYSWADVRAYYYTALTGRDYSGNIIASDKTQRDAYFAESFRGLGQLMHLVQDVSVPEHSRNDGHYLPSYEEWVAKPGNIDISTLSPIFFDMSTLIQPSKFANAPVPIANLFDTNQYNGSNPNDTVSNTIGLAEYSNANFVSPQTLFKDFTYPSKNTSVQVVDYDYPDPFNPGNYVKRQYYKKVADGETNQGNGYRLAGVDYLKFYRDANLSPTQADQIMVIPPMDDYVYSDYASLLLPRAVGYSAGLLNYFFRGTLEITAPDTYVYSIIDGSINPQQFTKIKAKVMNTTPNEQMQAGVLQAVAKYKKRTDYQPDLSTDPPAETSRETEFSYSVSAAIPISSLDSINPQEFTFNFEGSPIPAGITDLYLIVVFKGTLGNEIDTAIAAGMADLKEPTHHTFWNLTDRFSLGIYDAAASAYIYHLYKSDEIKSNPDLAKLVDKDGDGEFNEIDIGEPRIDPYDITFNISYMGSSSPANPPISTATAVLPAGRYMRLIVLVDRKYNNHVRTGWSDNIDTNNAKYDTLFEGVINQDINGVWQTPTPVIIFRGIRQHFYTGLLRCEPLAYDPTTMITYCPYPEEPAPLDTTPYQATINFK